MRRVFLLPIFGLLFYLFNLNLSWAKLTIPPLTRPIEDYAQILNQDEKEVLEQLMHKIYNKLGVQPQILILPSIEDENLEEFSIRLAESWKIGSKKSGNGIILLITMKEHNIRIEVGQGIEGTFTDYWSHQVINQIIVPQFKSENYYEGIRGFLTQLIKTLSNENLGSEVISQKEIGPKKLGIKTKSTYLFEIFILFFIIFAIVGPLFSQKFVKGMVLRGTLMSLLIGITSFIILGTILIKQILLFMFLGFIFGLIGPNNIILLLLSQRGGGGGGYYGGGSFGGGGSWGGGGGGFSGGGSSGKW